MRKVLLTIISLFVVQLAMAQQCSLSFNVGVNGLQVTVTNTTNWNLIPGSTPNMWVTWGDNNTSFINYNTNSTASHTYAGNGSYTVTLWAQYYDTLNNQMHCFDSTFQTVVINHPCATNIVSTHNGGGSYSFSANTIGGGTGLIYAWDFGDGNSTNGATVSHTYAASGTYVVKLASTGSGCTDTATATVGAYIGTINCSNLTANFSFAGIDSNRIFTNTSTPITGLPIGITHHATWDFGDGMSTTTTAPTASHVYMFAGTYTVKLVNRWIDSANNNLLYCIDSTTQQVTITSGAPQPNVISGNINWDNTLVSAQMMTFKTWLIMMDSAQMTLKAVDSSIVSASGSSVAYSFSNHPAGSYRVKAAVVNGTTGANLFVPTYHNSTAMWHTATVINHTGGASMFRHITMIPGTWTGGPGFVAGNISAGANKGTNGGMPNILVMLLNNQGDMVRFTYTDGNGDYAFGNIPAGTYSVYPEHMNFTTIPSAAINVVSGQYYQGGIDFTHTPTHIKPVATGVANTANKFFSIYPNPASSHVALRWSENKPTEALIQVTDITGRIVYSAKTGTQAETKIDVTSWQSGIYLIKMTINDAQHIERIVVQH